MAGETSAIGGIGVATSGVNIGFEGSGIGEEKEQKKVAYTNSIWQGLIPPPNASAIRA